MRPVYMVSGGITKFKKASPDKDFRYMVKDLFAMTSFIFLTAPAWASFVSAYLAM